MYDVEKSRVAKFFSQQVVFLTGATSGMGMVREHLDRIARKHSTRIFETGRTRSLNSDRRNSQMILYKILMCGPSKVFMLLRAKDGMSAQDRFKQLSKEDIFDSLPDEVFNQVTVVQGDITKPLLELNVRDLVSLRSTVTVSFTVRRVHRVQSKRSFNGVYWILCRWR